MPNEQDDPAALIAARRQTHGDFGEVAKAYCDLVDVVMTGRSWKDLTPIQIMSIEMILHKLSRVVCGNPNFIDHWADIAGYATLARNEAEKK